MPRIHFVLQWFSSNCPNSLMMWEDDRKSFKELKLYEFCAFELELIYHHSSLIFNGILFLPLSHSFFYLFDSYLLHLLKSNRRFYKGLGCILFLWRRYSLCPKPIISLIWKPLSLRTCLVSSEYVQFVWLSCKSSLLSDSFAKILIIFKRVNDRLLLLSPVIHCGMCFSKWIFALMLYINFCESRPFFSSIFWAIIFAL